MVLAKPWTVHRPLIPVLLDPAAKDPASWEGLVKFHLGGEMYFDLSKEPLESNQDAIAKLIQRIKEVAHAARRTSDPPPSSSGGGPSHPQPMPTKPKVRTSLLLLLCTLFALSCGSQGFE